MTLFDKQKEIEKKLETVTNAWQYEAKTILCHVLDLEPIELVLSKNKMLSSEEVALIDVMIKGRLQRVPLQYLTKNQGFFGLDFYVDEHVLIPRPETEVLVEYVLKYANALEDNSDLSILDIGVGSGAISIALAKRLKKGRVTGVDISEKALNVAVVNAKTHGVENKVTFFKSDLFENVKATYDIIVSNPPYIPVPDLATLEPEVANYEPHLALFGGEDGLDFYRRLIPESVLYLKKEGVLFLEAGHDQFEAIEKLFELSGFKEVNHFEDLNGIPRFIYGKR
ncbi:peptide chain release factor N(5)-glutamine methyltransferase [Fusibacter bizertensis]